jgi:hypothetical protein
MLRTLVLLAIALALAKGNVSAKRMGPKPVAPVVYEGVEYSAHGDGRDAYIVATSVETKKELWKVRVFHTRIKPHLEEDVQWVFITHLKIEGESLLVRDEKARCYSVGLARHEAKRVECGTAF